MLIHDAILFLKSHHSRTGTVMEWFEFEPKETKQASQALVCIKATFGSLPDINKAQIGLGNTNKSKLGFGLTRKQWDSILSTIPSAPNPSMKTSLDQTLSSYEAQMDFIHFYILHRIELDSLYQQQRLEKFFEDTPQYAHYKERVLRIKYLEQHQHVFFNERFLDTPPALIGDSLKIGYYPYANIPHKQNLRYNPQDIMLAPDGKEARHYSKHKLVYGPVDFYRHGKKPVTFNLITACAPNLMGSSPEDERQFLNRDGTLNQGNYLNACEVLADFIVQATSRQGNTKLIMPAFGVGVYINKVPANQKPQAVQMMYQAFSRAAQTIKSKLIGLYGAKRKIPIYKKGIWIN